MFPNTGTLGAYTQRSTGHFPAIVAVFAGYVVVAMLAIPAEMFFFDAMTAKLLPGVFPERTIPLAILLLLTVTNLVGAFFLPRLKIFLHLFLLLRWYF